MFNALHVSFGSRSSVVYKDKKLYTLHLLLPVFLFCFLFSVVCICMRAHPCVCAEVHRQVLICICQCQTVCFFYKYSPKPEKLTLYRKLNPQFSSEVCMQIQQLLFWCFGMFWLLYNIQLSSIKSFISLLRLAPGANETSKLKVSSQSNIDAYSLSSNFVLWKNDMTL